MGEDTAELFFGAEIKDYDDGEFRNVDDETERKIKEMGIEVNCPYETEEQYIMISESLKRVNNGGMGVGKELIPKREWVEKIVEALKMLGVTGVEPEYILVGHYD